MAKVTFKSVYYQNFLSVGNDGIEVDLNRSPTTLITGQNGSGKTTMLEAIIYGLYGKPYRKIKLAGLINSINKKKLLVKLSFDCKGNSYEIVRGMKPAKFEIYENGELIDQNSKNTDYQKIIDDMVGDQKVFTQTQVLNKAKFTPFLALSTPDRRKIVGDLLDINIYDEMLKVVKSDSSEITNTVNDIRHNQRTYETQIRVLESAIKDFNESDTAAISKLESRLSEQSKEVDTLTKKSKDLFDQYNAADDFSDEISQLQRTNNRLMSDGRVAASNVQSKLKSVEFFNKNVSCETCGQKLDENHVHDIKTRIDEEVTDIKSSMKSIKTDMDKNDKKIKELQEKQQVRDKLSEQLREVKSELNRAKSALETTEFDLKELTEKTNNNVDKYESELQEAESNNLKLEKELETVLQRKEIVDLAIQSLKENGIKATVIDKFIPVLNEKINDYLELMEFYVGVELDSEFNEVFTTPSRTEFSYHNLSDGQKTRLDLAILFAWLYVAGEKNSVESNLLFLDEILSAVDNEGITCVMNLMRVNFSNKNIFVIEQRRDLSDNFRSHINFSMVEGFTEKD